jgi:hypothetical protein
MQNIAESDRGTFVSVGILDVKISHTNCLEIRSSDVEIGFGLATSGLVEVPMYGGL